MSKQDIYKSKAWKQTRFSYALSKHCICERCGRAVYITGINEYLPKEQRLRYIVHHKKYLTNNDFKNIDIAYDWNNLELLCIDCHNDEHNPNTSTKKGYYFDEFGNLKMKETPHIKRV